MRSLPLFIAGLFGSSYRKEEMIDERARRLRRPALLLAAAATISFAGPSRLGAQSIQLSLENAIQQALTTNPELGVTQAQAEAANSQVVQARLRPNPRLTVQTEDIRPGTSQTPFSFVESTEDYLLIGQVIETAGKRRGRVQVASANAGVAKDQQELTRRQIVARVRAAYWNAVLARRIGDLTNQSLQTYDEDVRYIGNRVKEGVAAEGDLIRIQIERNRVHAALLQTARDSNQALISLFRAMGASEFRPAVLTTGLEERKLTDLPKLESALSKRPEIAIARLNIEQAENNVKLQHAYAKPDPEVFFGYKRNIGFDTAYAAVQVDLPVRNRNQGNIGSAQAQLHGAQSSLQVAIASVRADFESALRGYEDQQRLVATLPGIITQSADAERRARAAYREGGLELLRLLDAERSRIQSELDYARALTDLQQAITTLQAAAGEDISGELGK